jgi:arylsulfatase A-like enzyme
MKRPSITRLAVILSLAGFWQMTLAQIPASGASAGSGRPNILFVISDDVGVDVTSGMYPDLIENLVEHYGPKGLNHPEYRRIAGTPASTPVLDELARQGMVFTNVWAHPFCSPTRASIITGLYAAKTRVANYQDALSTNHMTFVRQLRDEGGYSTAVFGKWHMAGLPSAQANYPGMKPKQAGFDLFRGNLHAAIATFWSYDYQVQDASTPDNEWRSEAAPQRSLPGIAATTYAPVVKAADAIDWLSAQERENPDQPWFVWFAFNLSHATSQRAPTQMAVPNADTLNAASLAEMRACGGEFGTQNTGSCSGEAVMRAMTSSLDTILGKLLEVVDSLDPNTYVIYVGDNGTPMYGRPGLDFIDNLYITRTARGKGTVFESGARVPLAIRGPRIEAGSASTEFAHVADLYSTILDIAGLEVSEQVASRDGGGTVALDAVSLAPILFDGAASVRDANNDFILTETEDLMRGGIREVGARNGAYKVLCTDSAAMGQCSFYNLADDPLEEFPLAVPASCEAYADGSWTPADAAWHYCRLTDVVAKQSFL